MGKKSVTKQEKKNWKQRYKRYNIKTCQKVSKWKHEINENN